jgi:hypothetical protein
MNFAAVINQQTRGHILKLAKLSYPRSVGSNVIDVCLISAGMGCDPNQLFGHLKYLKDRGYITLQESRLEGFDTGISLIELTSEGIDLLEGTTTDKGVKV